MNSKRKLLIAVTVVLAVIYAYLFTDWIQRPHIQIIAQTRPIRPGGSSSGVYPVSFLLDGQYHLSSVKVVLLSTFETNRYAVPLWYLVTDTNPPPVEGFLYGSPLQGMRSAVSNAQPEPLRPSTVYRLLVKSGRATGQIDF